MVKTLVLQSRDRPIRLLDPAVGDGQLLLSLLRCLKDKPTLDIYVGGFETDSEALKVAKRRIEGEFPQAKLHFEIGDFLEFVLDHFGASNGGSLFPTDAPPGYDLIIANPPYIRTQILGAKQAQLLSKRFGLGGRVDIYYAFILAIAQVLNPEGVTGIIVSNRFMTTRSGSGVRRAILERLNLRHVWDFGDTKLFTAAVLPAVIVAEGKNGTEVMQPTFTSIYETKLPAVAQVESPIAALSLSGVMEVKNGRRFLVQQGILDVRHSSTAVWRLSTHSIDSWLETVQSNTWKMFGDVGKIRVGVKTCADKVFIRSDWHQMSDELRPELLRPLITHQVARRFKPAETSNPMFILYPHEGANGQRHAVDLNLYPKTKTYLESHRAVLESRKYLLESSRKWYEIWVPQEPSVWSRPKLVFRDIIDEPTFWIDEEGTIVNGDCYWFITKQPDQTDLLWLAAAIGNSRFIERFYDLNFNNKLYAGRRRFLTQYVERFPLPSPNSPISRRIVIKAKEIYSLIPSPEARELQAELENLVLEAFGLPTDEVFR